MTQLTVGWGADYSNTEMLDFTTIHYTVIVSIFSDVFFNN